MTQSAGRFLRHGIAPVRGETMKRSLRISALVLAAGVAALPGCATKAPIPLAENFDLTVQPKVRSAGHWDLLSNDVVTQTLASLKNVQVPANTPIQVQTLDANGMAVRTCAWIWVKNKAKRGCVGCHEDNELSPENVFSAAVGKDAHDLTGGVEHRREVRFDRDVQPVLKAKCMTGACHVGAPAPSLRYEDLLAKGYVNPAAARLSPLVWYIHGKVTAQSWDKVSGNGPLKKIKPGGEARLTSDEKRAIVEWIDTGAHR